MTDYLDDEYYYSACQCEACKARRVAYQKLINNDKRKGGKKNGRKRSIRRKNK